MHCFNESVMDCLRWTLIHCFTEQRRALIRTNAPITFPYAYVTAFSHHQRTPTDRFSFAHITLSVAPAPDSGVQYNPSSAPSPCHLILLYKSALMPDTLSSNATFRL